MCNCIPMRPKDESERETMLCASGQFDDGDGSLLWLVVVEAANIIMILHHHFDNPPLSIHVPSWQNAQTNRRYVCVAQFTYIATYEHFMFPK